MVIEVTDLAKKELDIVLEAADEGKRLKIYVAGHGWAGPSFGMALEEPEEEDLQVDVDGYPFLVGDGLEDIYDKFVVDYTNNPLRRGFMIVPGEAK